MEKSLHEETLNEFPILATILAGSASVILSASGIALTNFISNRRSQRLKYIDNLHYKNEESVEQWLSMNLGTLMSEIKKRGTKDDYRYAKELYDLIYDNTEIATVKLVDKLDKDGNKEDLIIFNAKAKLKEGYKETGTKLKMVVVKGAFGEDGRLLKKGQNKTAESINNYIGRINRIYWRLLGDSEDTIEDRYKNGFGKDKSLLITQPKQQLKLTEEAKMTLDEEIALGKAERELNNKTDSLLEGIDFTANEYMIKYNKNAELLREYDYLGRISELVREKKETDYKKVIALREDINENLSLLNSKDPEVLKEAYTNLAKIYFKIK